MTPLQKTNLVLMVHYFPFTIEYFKNMNKKVLYSLSTFKYGILKMIQMRNVLNENVLAYFSKGMFCFFFGDLLDLNNLTNEFVNIYPKNN